MSVIRFLSFAINIIQMKKVLLFILLGLAGIAGLQAQSPPPTADGVLSKAFADAAKEKKNVFVIFHASWCGWCHKMDTAMNDPLVKKFFDDNYVIKHLTVLESEKNKQLENPGAMEVLVKYKFNKEKDGIPYWFIFDKTGKLLADCKMRPEGASMEDGDNMGCPASEKEVEYFIKILKQTSKIDEAGLAMIKTRFRKTEGN